MVLPVATPSIPRTPLLLVASAFGAAAALLVAQTLAFHLVAWDSSAIGTLSALLRALFLVADVAVVVALEWPIVVLAMGVSVVFAAGALGRVGKTLGEPALVRQARWVQGLAVATGAGLLGLLFAGLVAYAERWTHARSAAGAIVLAAHVLIAVPSVLAVIVLHAVLVGGARKALAAYADRRVG